jgi:hypothetical protein
MEDRDGISMLHLEVSIMGTGRYWNSNELPRTALSGF